MHHQSIGSGILLGVRFNKTQGNNLHFSLGPTPVGHYLKRSLQLRSFHHATALGLQLSRERDHSVS